MRSVLVALLLIVPAVAEAQGPYVGASVLADIVRMSGSSNGFNAGSGETFGGAIRVGASLGSQWGVDLEFARSGEIEWQPPVAILSGGTGRFSFTGGVPGGTTIPQLLIFPPPQISSRQRLSTLTTTLFWRQDVGERFQLMYLGGVAFNRTVRKFRLSYPPFVEPTIPEARVRLLPQAVEDRSVLYDAGVVVGLDASIGMSEHLRLVPGLRLLNATPGAWVVRPGVGLHWMF
jgi:hypothetical protein